MACCCFGLAKPNAGGQPLWIAAAERRLSTVGCTAVLDDGWRTLLSLLHVFVKDRLREMSQMLL
jgi:hypothetical protein